MDTPKRELAQGNESGDRMDEVPKPHPTNIVRVEAEGVPGAKERWVQAAIFALAAAGFLDLLVRGSELAIMLIGR